MADVFTRHELLTGNSRTEIVVVTGVVDSGGTTIAIDKSELTLEPMDTKDIEALCVEKIEWTVGGIGHVIVAWDYDPDVTALVLSGSGEMCFTGGYGPSLRPPVDAAGGTGDVTITAAAGTGTFTVVLRVSY